MRRFLVKYPVAQFIAIMLLLLVPSVGLMARLTYMLSQVTTYTIERIADLIYAFYGLIWNAGLCISLFRTVPRVKEKWHKLCKGIAIVFLIMVIGSGILALRDLLTLIMRGE